jgi:hypothetical protein
MRTNDIENCLHTTNTSKHNLVDLQFRQKSKLFMHYKIIINTVIIANDISETTKQKEV